VGKYDLRHYFYFFWCIAIFAKKINKIIKNVFFFTKFKMALMVIMLFFVEQVQADMHDKFQDNWRLGAKTAGF